MPNQSVIVLDFGGQYNQLIARRVRECNVYCEVKPNTMTVDEIRAFDPIGIIFTGGPQSVYAEGSPQVDPEIFRLGIPILGICYGCQLMAQYLGGEVTAAGKDTAREYGKTETWFDTDCRLFRGLPEQSITWMSHGDYMAKVPDSFRLVAHSDACPTVGICDEARGFYGVQFHPEVNHTEYGQAMLRNFLYEVCGATGDWTMGDFMRKSIEDIRAKVGDGKVLLALSGGVDSSVAAALLAEAVGNQLTCIFVDHGLLRKNEGDEVEAAFQNWDINFVRVNAEERFLTRLKDVSDPETKRKIIGRDFVEVFNAEAKQIENVKWLAQGTIYPDVVESASASVKGPAAMIKSHHNVGGLPEEMHLKIVEPLRLLFKDEVRRVGKSLGIDPQLLGRHPFPGPGLAIRILGDITPEKVEILQNVDKIYIDALREWGLYDQVWQAGAILLPVKSVGVMGDERTYESCVALRAVASTDGMTADWVHLPYDFLAAVSNDIINKVRGVNRVVYDISSKPPATIEWE
jgi:GMP synthase (glutamine-hydrolysing)